MRREIPLEFNPNTGVLSGTIDTPGTYTIVVTAANSTGSVSGNNFYIQAAYVYIDVPDFTWTPDINFTSEPKPRVLEANLGYSHRAASGINIYKDEWRVSFNNRSIHSILDIESFLIAKKGATRFNWNPPGETETYKVICTDWNSTMHSTEYASLQTTFKRVY